MDDVIKVYKSKGLLVPVSAFVKEMVGKTFLLRRNAYQISLRSPVVPRLLWDLSEEYHLYLLNDLPHFSVSDIKSKKWDLWCADMIDSSDLSYFVSVREEGDIIMLPVQNTEADEVTYTVIKLPANLDGFQIVEYYYDYRGVCAEIKKMRRK